MLILLKDYFGMIIYLNNKQNFGRCLLGDIEENWSVIKN